jgi:hypothetical protein
MSDYRDVVWDTLEELFGSPTNDPSRARRNKAVTAIRQSTGLPTGKGKQQVEAEGDFDYEAITSLIKEKFDAYPDYLGTITDVAFANNWDRIDLDKAEESRETSVVEETYKALWPRTTFDINGWRRILQGFGASEILDMMERISYSSPFPPGAGEVRRRLINQRLGDKAPPTLEEALSLYHTRRQQAAAGLPLDHLHPLIYDAWHDNDRVFEKRYQERLELFYINYDPAS